MRHLSVETEQHSAANATAAISTCRLLRSENREPFLNALQGEQNMVQSRRREASQRGGTGTASQLSITACLRCREQKLKCGRERPLCGRCDRLNSTCVYPDPPNRRGPRAKRKQRLLNETDGSRRDRTASRQNETATSNPLETFTIEQQVSNSPCLPCTSSPRYFGARRQSAVPAIAADDSGTGYTSTVLEAESPVLSNTYQSQLRRTTSLTAKSALGPEQCPPLPPTSLGLALLEIYFSRIYNASLLFHKPTLFQHYLDGKLYSSLLKGLFALATLFLQLDDKTDEYSAPPNEEFRALSAYRSSGLPWAQSALQEAMSLAMQSPSLMAVQALQCIQLYWFGVGQPHQGNLCLALAYRSCQMLGFDRRPPNTDDVSSQSFQDELGRRCFWACWTSTCIVMEPEPYISAAWEQAAMLPLPSSITSNPDGYRISFTEAMNKSWQSIPVLPVISDNCPPTASGALIKIIGIWAKIQLLCKHCSLPISKEDLTSAHTLSRLAELLFDGAVANRASAREAGTTVEAENLYLFHDGIYHQCQLVLHSLMVPLFCGTPSNRSADCGPQSRMKAAQTVLNHADASETLLSPFLDGEEDISRLPPLLGYSMFVVGTVFLTVEVAQRNESASELPIDTRNRRLGAVERIIRLLDTLAGYWTVLKEPRDVLRSALKAHLSALREPLEPSQSRIVQIEGASQDDSRRAALQMPHQATSAVDESRTSSVNGSSTERHAVETCQSFTNVAGGHHDPSADLVGVTDNPYPGNTNLLSDYEWYGMSLAEAGIEELVGFEPSNLFQQGWKMFS